MFTGIKITDLREVFSGNFSTVLLTDLLLARYMPKGLLTYGILNKKLCWKSIFLPQLQSRVSDEEKKGDGVWEQSTEKPRNVNKLK